MTSPHSTAIHSQPITTHQPQPSPMCHITLASTRLRAWLLGLGNSQNRLLPAIRRRGPVPSAEPAPPPPLARTTRDITVLETPQRQSQEQGGDAEQPADPRPLMEALLQDA